MAFRIGVDATGWLNRRGYGRYTRSLLTALARIDRANAYTLFIDEAAAGEALPEGVTVRRVFARVPAARAAAANGRRALPDLLRMSRALADPALDVLFFPSLHTFVPVASRARKIVAIHDVIPEAFPEMALGGRSARFFWKLKSLAARRQAHAVVTVSEYARSTLEERLGLDSERVHVVGEAADPVFRPIVDAAPGERLLSLGIARERPSIVFVGGMSPHKNLATLVAAFSAIAARMPESRLVLVGDLDSEVYTSALAGLRRDVEASPARDRILFAGPLPDEDLAILLNLATVLVLPSMMEGFGLPALEAAACGCPVIATTASPLPDLLGEAALYVHPHDGVDLERALLRVLDSRALRERMAAAGLAAAARLGWEDAARRLLDVIERA